MPEFAEGSHVYHSYVPLIKNKARIVDNVAQFSTGIPTFLAQISFEIKTPPDFNDHSSMLQTGEPVFAQAFIDSKGVFIKNRILDNRGFDL